MGNNIIKQKDSLVSAPDHKGPSQNSPRESRKGLILKRQLTRGVKPSRSINLLLDRAAFDDRCTEEYIELADYLERTHGAEPATKTLKAIHQMVTHSVTHNNVEQLGPWNLKLDRRGLPRILKQKTPTIYRLLRHRDFEYKRIAMSTLRSYELIRGKEEYNVSSIVERTNAYIGYTSAIGCHEHIQDQFKDKVFRDLFLDFLESSEYGARKVERYRKLFDKERGTLVKTGNPLFFTNKAGPRGYALGTLEAQSADIGPNLKELLTGLANHIGLFRWRDCLESSQTIFGNCGKSFIRDSPYLTVLPVGVVGRLNVIPDKGWKHRLIAICNTWVQMVLRPYHKVLMETLRFIPCDSSFDQQSGAERVKAQTNVNKDVSSVDLSNATDLILADMICDDLSVMDTELSVWLDIVRGMTFYNPASQGICCYNTGNPMGLYTSFGGLAHWHNSMYQFSNFLVTGKRDRLFYDYQVLGDDSCCWDSKVSSVYKHLCKCLHLKISEGKCYYSNPEEGYSVAEFAKRTFINGIEITGCSQTLAQSVFGSGQSCSLEYIPLLLLHLESHGFLKEPKTGLNSRLRPHFSWTVFKRAVKHSCHKAGKRRIEALYLFTQVHVFLYARRLKKNVYYNDSESADIMIYSHPTFPGQEFNTLLHKLVALKREKLTDKLGGNYGSLTIAIDKLIRYSSSYFGIDKPYSGSHYTLLLAQQLQREFTSLYERCAGTMYEPREPLLENLEVETLRSFDGDSIYTPSSEDKVTFTKRQRQLHSLYEVCKEYLEEMDEED